MGLDAPLKLMLFCFAAVIKDVLLHNCFIFLELLFLYQSIYACVPSTEKRALACSRGWVSEWDFKRLFIFSLI